MTVTGRVSLLNDIQEEEKHTEEDFQNKMHKFSEDDLKVFKNSITKKHNTKAISSLVNVDISPAQRNQLEKNQELELTHDQETIIKSMKMKYNPQCIFANLPGDEENFGTKIAKSRIFQFEIEGSKYSKITNDISKGIFKRNISYFIVVHKTVKNSKSLGINSNNVIFLWKGEDGLNITKNAIEKYITTPFQEMKIHKDTASDIRNAKKGSVVVNNPISLLKKSLTLQNKVETSGGFGLHKPITVIFFLLF